MHVCVYAYNAAINNSVGTCIAIQKIGSIIYRFYNKTLYKYRTNLNQINSIAVTRKYIYCFGRVHKAHISDWDSISTVQSVGVDQN